MNERTEKRHLLTHPSRRLRRRQPRARNALHVKKGRVERGRPSGAARGCLDCFLSTSADCCMLQVSARYALRTFYEVKVEEFHSGLYQN